MILAHFDGACEPKNPGGQMGIGAFIQSDDELLMEYSQSVEANSENSNNVAEYMGMLSILHWLVANGYTQDEVLICGDSQLAIKQMKGEYGMHRGRYITIAKECQALAKHFSNLSFQWVPREENKRADDLSKKSLTCKVAKRRPSKKSIVIQKAERSAVPVSDGVVILNDSENPFDVL